MSDYAPNFTARYRIRYASLGKQHNMTFRMQGPGRTPSVPFLAGVKDFLDASAAIRYSDWTILTALSADQNSDAFLPADVPPAITAGVATPGPISFRPVFVSFQGLSDLANRCSVYMFGVALDPAQGSPGVSLDYRITSAEDATTANLITALASIPEQIAIDRELCNWHSYMNIGYHSYYQRKARGA